MSHKQLTLQQRYHISAFRKCGYTQKEITKELGVSPSTISRELRRNINLDGQYHPEYAASETKLRHQQKRKHTVSKKSGPRSISPEGCTKRRDGKSLMRQSIVSSTATRPTEEDSTDICVTRTKSIIDTPLRKTEEAISPEEWRLNTVPKSWRRNEESEI